MELTDKVYLKKQFIDPTGNFTPPGTYLYGELSPFIRDNPAYVALANNVVVTKTILNKEPETINIAKEKKEETVKINYVVTHIADNSANNANNQLSPISIEEIKATEEDNQFVPKKIRDYKKKEANASKPTKTISS